MINAKSQYEDEQEFQMTEGRRQYLEFLIHGSCYQPDQQAEMERRVADEMTEAEYLSFCQDLQNNALDRIPNGLSYNQGDITAHLRRLK